MNKAIIAIVAALVLGTAGFFVLGGDDDTTQTATTPQSTTTETTPTTADSTAPAQQAPTQDAGATEPANGGQYVDFSEQALADASGSSRVVFFHAQWCSTCKFFENDIKSAGVPADITILEADYDTETALKDKYGVSVQSTFVLLNDAGEVVRTWPFASGLRSAQDLYAAVAAEV